jgi:hypothetical protein
VGAPVQPGAATLGREEEGSEARRWRWRTMAAALGFSVGVVGSNEH